MKHRNLIGRALAFGACAVLMGAALTPVSVAAAGPGSVSGGPHQLSGAGPTIAAGDEIAVGYDLSMAGQHGDATVSVEKVEASFQVSCSPHGGDPVTVRIDMPDTQVTIHAGDNHWYPTDQADAAPGYEASAAAPDACEGHPMQLQQGGQNGVTYTATLLSADTSDHVTIRFHAVDGTTGGKHSRAVDCSSAQANPHGGAACNGSWTPSVTTTAGPTPAAANDPAPNQASNSTPPPSEPPSNTAPSPGDHNGPGNGTGPGSGAGTGTAPGQPNGTATGTGAGSGTGTGSGTVTSSGSGTGASTGSAATTGSLVVVPAHSSAPALGLSLPGGAVLGISTGPRGEVGTSAPNTGRAPFVPATPASHPPATVNTTLGPVPVLVPTIADAITRAGTSLPWNWFAALAVVDALLVALIVIRRRRAVHPA